MKAARALQRSARTPAIIPLALVLVLMPACGQKKADEPVTEGPRSSDSFRVGLEEQQALEARAGKGDAVAAFRLFEHFAFAARDDVAARLWLRRAAEMGHIVAQYNLGAALVDEGESREAAQWLTRAAEAAKRSGDAETERLAVAVLGRLERDTRSAP